MSDEQQSQNTKPTGLAAFWAELKRRKVMPVLRLKLRRAQRVGITFAVVSWLVFWVAKLDKQLLSLYSCIN